MGAGSVQMKLPVKTSRRWKSAGPRSARASLESGGMSPPGVERVVGEAP